MNFETLKKKIQRVNLDGFKVLFRFDTDKLIRFDVSGKPRLGWKEFKPDELTQEGMKAAEIEIKEKEIEGVAKQEFRAMYHSLLIARRK